MAKNRTLRKNGFWGKMGENFFFFRSLNPVLIDPEGPKVPENSYHITFGALPGLLGFRGVLGVIVHFLNVRS